MNYRNSIQWAALASGIVASAAVLGFIGYWLDGYFGSSPWGFVSGATLGMIVGLYNFINFALKRIL